MNRGLTRFLCRQYLALYHHRGSAAIAASRGIAVAINHRGIGNIVVGSVQSAT